MKLTKWYPPHVRPVRAGVYNTTGVDAHPLYRYWSGEIWGLAGSTPKRAHVVRNMPAPSQNHRWRGLTEKTK